MIPSATAASRRSPCPCCRRRRRNVAAGRSPLIGSSVTARALAAGLWRLGQAERSAARRQDNPPSLLGGRKAKQRTDFGVGKKQSCRSHGNGNGILDKEVSMLDSFYKHAQLSDDGDALLWMDQIEAACCVVDDYSSHGIGGSMEKATKWDYLNNSNKHLLKEEGSSSSRRRRKLEAALEKARAQIGELEDDRRLATKKLMKVAEEKAWWKSKARCAAAALREELKMERHHRRQLEAANGKLMKELATARLSAKQAAQRVETERKARELMEEACEELSKEVEEDQAEVEALRRECVAMREEMEEERRMLQMAEVWREERVQMKLSDAKAVLEHKYAHLNTLQAEMESFLLRHGHRNHNHNQLRGTANGDGLFPPATSYKNPHAPEDVDKVFDHFRRKNTKNRDTTATRSSSTVASPATDLFLEKVDDDADGGWPWERGTPPPDGTMSNSNAAAACSNNNNNGGSGVTEEGGSGGSRRSGNFNTALIRRLWRSAISESRRKTASSSGRNRVLQNGCAPYYSDRDRGRDRDTARSSVIDQGSQGGSAAAAAAAREEEMRKKK